MGSIFSIHAVKKDVQIGPLPQKAVFSGQEYVSSRLCFLWKPLAFVQELLVGRVEFRGFLDVASKRLPVLVPPVSAVRTVGRTTVIFNPVTEPFPSVYIHGAASSPSDVDQLPRRSGYLLLAVWGIKVILGLCPDQLESFATLFTFPRVELHFTNTVFHIETKILGKGPSSI